MNLNKSIVVSIRLKPSHLAKALDGIMQYDKSFIPDRLTDIVRNTFLHGINYLSYSLPIEPSVESVEIIKSLTLQGKGRKKRKKRNPHDIFLNPDALEEYKRRRIILNKKALEQEIKTESKKSIVTDFNPSELIDNKEEE